MSVQWIVDGLKASGKSKIGLAKKLGRSPSMVTALLKGDRELKAREINIIASYLGVQPPAPTSTAESEPELRVAFIVGDVAGGVWTDPGLEFDPIPTTVAVDAKWPEGSVYILRVQGRSINRQAKDGDMVLCLDVHAAPRSFQAGDWVIAERISADGKRETTVKRVSGNSRAGFILMPDSDDPAFQDPIPLGRTDGETVEVKAFVLEFIKKATKF